MMNPIGKNDYDECMQKLINERAQGVIQTKTWNDKIKACRTKIGELQAKEKEVNTNNVIRKINIQPQQSKDCGWVWSEPVLVLSAVALGIALGKLHGPWEVK